jgi:hypothetical protein
VLWQGSATLWAQTNLVFQVRHWLAGQNGLQTLFCARDLQRPLAGGSQQLNRSTLVLGDERTGVDQVLHAWIAELFQRVRRNELLTQRRAF